jgi:membrane protease YdiL (CAAX protease family)
VTPEPWLRRHPLIGYFALTYAISWGGILIVLSATGFDPVGLRALDTGLIFVLMLLGPSLSGLALTARLEGRAGLRRLVAGLTRWRVRLRWYAVALLTTPFVLLAVLWPMSAVVDPAYSPGFQWPLFAIGIMAGCCEEIGWTGFATPRLLARLRLTTAGCSLGVIWALWHALVDFRQNFSVMGGAWVVEFAILYVANLTAYRLLMTWVYANTQSLLLAMLMHASYTGWLIVLYPVMPFEQGLLWQAAVAAGLWVAVIAVVRIQRLPL